MLNDINRKLEEKYEVVVLFADNLSTHKIEDSLTFFKNKLPVFAEPRFYPPNLTMSLQSIDRYIGIIYKKAV